MSSSGPRVRNRMRRRRYCFTLPNPNGAEFIIMTNVLADGNVAEHCSMLSFLIMQSERGQPSVNEPDGLFHYQCYVEFKKAIEWNTVNAIFSPVRKRCHVEGARTNANVNIRYCSKLDSRCMDHDHSLAGQWGRAKQSGGSCQVAIKIQNKMPVAQVVDEHPGFALLNMTNINNFVSYVKGPRKKQPEIVILCGKTGSGKSQFCVKEYPDAYWVNPPTVSGKVWWGNYHSQDVCVLDDFHAGWFPLTMLLRLLDSTPYMVHPKGHETIFNSGVLVFTSNIDPRDWYKNFKGDAKHKKALERRIREFAKIYDCSVVEPDELSFDGDGEDVLEYRRVVRPEDFQFRELDFSIRAGNGDVSQGNGFNMF